MEALTDWPDYISVDAGGHLAYRCPYFELAVTLPLGCPFSSPMIARS